MGKWVEKQRRPGLLKLGCTLATGLSCVLALLLPESVAAQEAEVHEASDKHATVSDASPESSGSHGEEHHHKNHIAIFIGATEAEEHHGEQEDPDFTLGLDYERRFSRLFGAGILLDFVVEGKRDYVVGVPLFLHVGRSAKFQLAPGFHHLSHSGENEFLLRTGFMWEFPIKRISLLPAIYYDFAEGQNFIILGVNIATGF